MRSFAVALLMAAGCGRISFDAILGDSGDGGDGDSGVFVDTCFRGIAVGNSHSCVIDGRGDVWCWGSNRGRQTDPNAGPDSIGAPRKVALPRPAVQLAVGTWVSCARLDDNTVRCWGADNSSQLGDGPTDGSPGPVTPLLGEPVDDIEAGAATICARRASDHSVVCWGSNAMSETGTGITAATVDAPTPVPGTAGAKELALAHHHGCFIDASNTAQCWGRGGAAEIGLPANDQVTPRVVAGYGAAAHIARGGGRFTCVSEMDGNVRCVGLDNMLQLGRADGFPSGAPVDPITTGAVDVSLGAMSGCALYPDHHVACWGDGTDGVIGPNSLQPTIAPTTVLTNVNALASGAHHVCALRGTQVWCWGLDEYGQLGRGSVSLQLAPAPVSGLTNINVMSVGFEHMCVRSGTELQCMGMNSDGQLGDGSRVSRAVPEVIATGGAFEGVAAGGAFTCIWGGGIARCAGRADTGQTGDDTFPSQSLAFHTVPVLSGVTRVDAGAAHACAINGGVVRCWGNNFDGELGDNTTTYAATPTTTGISGATDVSAGGYNSCAIAGGVLSCWGANGRHQVDSSASPELLTPTTISFGAETPTQVSAGLNHICAVMTSGLLFCWGGNDAGEVGNSTTTDVASPFNVTLPGAAAEVRAGYKFTCARLQAGTVYCWGINENGELGDGTDNWSSVPVQVSGITDAVAIDVGKDFACARRASNTITCWGSERRGHLGSGRLTLDATPTPVALSCTP